MSESVCRHSRLSPTRISLADISMSSRQSGFSSDRARYLPTMPACVSVPVISSSVRRRSLTCPESFRMRANCSTASMNFTAVSLSCISFGTICPRHSVLQLLCRLMRSFVVLVRNR